MEDLPDFEELYRGILQEPKESEPLEPPDTGDVYPFWDDPPENSLETVEARAAELLQTYPSAALEVVRYIAARSGERLIRFMTDRSRSPREAATFRAVLEKGYTTKEECIQSGFDSVVTRDLTKHGVVFRSRRGRIELQVEESEATLGGVLGLPSRIRDAMIQDSRRICALCGHQYERKRLVLDHRVPHRVAGNTLTEVEGTSAYQVVCDSCNNRKQQACRGCQNQQHTRDTSTCRRCRWASPGDYDHVAGQPERHLVLVARTEGALSQLSTIEELARKWGLT